MTLFDDYLIVDWSANASPKTGADSIWYCRGSRDRRGRLRLSKPQNPATRKQAFHELKRLLLDRIKARRRVLLGFDLPNGYPVGFAKAAGFADRKSPPWLATWQALSERIEDSSDNANNRFDVANDLNKRLAGAPFWGCPHGRVYSYLRPTKPNYGNTELAERRICERWVRRTQPVWKLYTTGSVGSQTLMGIPYQLALLRDRELAPYLDIWPFRTGLAAPAPTSGAKIVLAEVYPSLTPIRTKDDDVKDAVQVRETAKMLAKRDNEGLLAVDFTGPPELTRKERKFIEQEEGWILGAGTFTPIVSATSS